MEKIFILLVIILTCCITSPLYPDTIYLKDGRSIEGEIIRETDEAVTIKERFREYGFVTSDYKKSDIEQIERAGSKKEKIKDAEVFHLQEKIYSEGYKDAKWGMSRGQVKGCFPDKKFGKEMVSKVASAMSFKTTIADEDAFVILSFFNNKLFVVTEIIRAFDRNLDKYIPKFHKLENLLLQKYGEPSKKIRSKSDDPHISDATSISRGKGMYCNRWYTSETEIALTLTCESLYSLDLRITYVCIELNKEYERKRDSSFTGTWEKTPEKKAPKPSSPTISDIERIEKVSEEKSVSTDTTNDKMLIEGTIETAKSLIHLPLHDVRITYDKDTSIVYVKFKTPSYYKVDYSNFYERWRDTQWVVLQEFKKAGIPVNEVTVETNYCDMSGLLKITNSTEHIDKYAKRADDDLWLRTAVSYQKSSGSGIWKKLDY